HGYFVEDSLIRKRRQFRHKLELRRTGWETGFHFGDIRDPLPSHPCAQLADSRNLVGERHMTSEENTHAGVAGGAQDLRGARDRLFAVGYFANDADLHVIDHQRHAIRIAEFIEGLRDFEAESTLHFRISRLGKASDTSDARR